MSLSDIYVYAYYIYSKSRIISYFGLLEYPTFFCIQELFINSQGHREHSVNIRQGKKYFFIVMDNWMTEKEGRSERHWGRLGEGK